MPGPTMIAMMVVPIVLAAAVAVWLARREPDMCERFDLRGTWLVLPGLVVTLLARSAHEHTDFAQSLVNRSEASAQIALVIAFLALNRHLTALPWARAGRDLLSVGIVMNAAAVAVYGYMPVLRASAQLAGHPVSANAPVYADYRLVDHPGPFVILLGDVIPVPDALKVLSLGDLAMMAGLSILLGWLFARLAHQPEAAERVGRSRT